MCEHMGELSLLSDLKDFCRVGTSFLLSGVGLIVIDVPIGRFSEAGLLEWMRFVIFRARSREMSQRTSRPISE